MIVGIRGAKFIRVPIGQIPGSNEPMMRSASPGEEEEPAHLGRDLEVRSDRVLHDVERGH